MPSLDQRETVYEALHLWGGVNWPEPEQRVVEYLTRIGRAADAPDFTQWLWTFAEFETMEAGFEGDLEVLVWLYDHAFRARDEGRCEPALLDLLSHRKREFDEVAERCAPCEPSQVLD